MGAFEEYYKQWKEKNNITTETPYQNLTDEQKRQRAIEDLDERYNTIKQSQQNTSTWNQVQNVANNNLNNFNNQTQNKNPIFMFNNTNKANIDNDKNKINQILNMKEGQGHLVIDNKEMLSKLDRQDRIKQIHALLGGSQKREEVQKAILEIEKLAQERETQEEADKINKDIKKGNYWSSIGHILSGIPQEALNSVINMFGAMDSILPNPSNAPLLEDSLSDAAKIMGKSYQQTTSKIDNDIVKTASGVSGTIGQMVPSILANLVAPGSGNVVSAITSGTSSYMDNLNEDNSNKLQSGLTGVAKGLVTYGTEKIIGGNFLSKGSLDDFAKGVISKLPSDFSKKVASKIYEFGGEALEEQLENQAGYVIDKVINNKNITPEEWVNDFNETNKMTLLTTAVLNLMGLGGNTYKEIKQNEQLDSKTKELIQEAENVIKEEGLEIKKPIEDNNMKQTTQINNAQNITQEQQDPLTQNIQQQDNMQQINQNEINNIQNTMQEQQNSIEQQSNGNMSNFIQLAKNEQTNVQKYQYEKSDNVKIDNLRQDANRLFDNSEQAHNYINMLEQIVQDKDVEIRFDNTLTDENGNMVNGRYKDGVITINPNSTKAGEFIAIHELTHAIGTKDMIDIVENYRKSNVEFDTAVQDLLKSYNQTEITEEALADVSAQLFGNQEFVNNLSQTNPSIFKKIYNEIKYLWHQFRGYKNQNQFIEDLQYKWEQAYRSSNELNNTTNYSIQTDNNGNRYVRVDTDQDIFEGINEKDYNKIAKMYMQDYLEGKTKLTENDTVKIGNKGINKYTNPKQQTRYMNEKMQLSTELKNVLEVAEKVNSSLPTKDTSKFPNWEYYKVNFEIGGKNFEGLINIGIDKKGNKHFYEINKIHITSNSHISTSKSSNTDSINNSILPTQENVNSDTQKYSMQESENNSGSFNLKEKQLEIIQKNNPMQDDYHTGIRNIEDIKTFEETLQDSDWADYDEFNPDYTKSMAEDAIKTGKITVYSSYPIKQGTFISPSYMEAESYSGDGKVYSKEVDLRDVAWIDPTQGQYAKVENNKYSKQNENWQEYLDNNFKSEGTRTDLQDINLPTKETIQKSNKTLNLPTKETIQKSNIQQDLNIPTKKILNPTEISNLTKQDASTTPNLPTKNYKKGNKESSFYSNITESSQFLNENLRDEMVKEENIQYYQGITNKETLEKAYTQLEDGGQQETLNWFTKDNKNIDATDVAKGWILLKQYQDSGNYQSAVEVAKKMREMGTKAGQTIQAYNILSRLTPEGMFYYAQSELTEAYNKMVEGKSQKWIEENRDKFELTPSETQFIKDTMQEVSEMKEGYDKKVKIAEIQKILTDKIPSTAGQSIKAWMRISMLFNPKTQVRNVLGNAVILPVNSTSDFISSSIDTLISKKTGIRTTGNMSLKNYGKGFGKGLYESYNDFRKGINTRNIEGNRFEVSEGRSFNNKGIGKALNRVDNILSFMLDAGDRGFYEATFTNSINNQLTLNNTTEVTQDMIDIATNEALQRTWQDNNTYTESVLKIRNILNKANIKGYGLGDVIIPFAKTPANLTKAIVDYSPIGLTKAITTDAIKFKNSLSNGQYTPQMQHKLVQNIGKGMAGTFLYVLGYGLAKAGIATGESDDDKDVKNFMKNSLGISSYSLKIGDKTFSYDWAQPVATPLAIMTNYLKYSEENPNANIIEKGIKSLNIGTEQLLQQSFMESLNTILNGNGTTLENLSQSILELPARSIPTFSKQIADMVDGTQRTSFEYGKPVQSAINSIKSKIPELSKSLPVSVDTLGNEIKKYGGDNNWFNVLLNPANVNKGQLSKSGEEIYRLYKQTGSTTVFPITAPYYVNNKGEKITMTAEERSKYQKVSGQYTEKVIKDLLSNNDYKKLSDSKKVELIEDIISDSNAKAKYDVLKIESEDAKKRRELIEKVQPKYYYDYSFKIKDIEGEDAIKRKNEVILNANYPNKTKGVLYQNITGKQDDLYNNILSKDDVDVNEYLGYKIQEFESDKEDDGTLSGKSVSGSKKKKVYNYVNNMKITMHQKMAILGTQYKLNRNEQKELYNYINNIPNQTAEEKLEIFKKYSSNFTIYKNGTLSLK